MWLAFGALVSGGLTGCSWKEVLPLNPPTLPNAIAIDRALQLCSITHGSDPFHLLLEINPPSQSGTTASPETAAMQAEIEIWWLNPITYRTVIRSAAFNQTRIVNGPVIEEHNTGSFYPRWIQNFVDGIFDPVPRAALLHRQPGSIPVSQESHACIANPAGAQDETAFVQVCFQGSQPLLASGVDFTRYVAYDNFRAFGSQLIPRTLTNDLPGNLLVPARVVLLEPLPKFAYPLLKATELTPLSQQIRTTLVSKEAAAALLEQPGIPRKFADRTHPKAAAFSHDAGHASGERISLNSVASPEGNPATIYVRTDRTGKVREAYTDSADVFGLHKAAAARALELKFKPLIVNGAAQQMEAPIEVP